MLSDKMQAALNDQVNAELYSAYLYLAMSADFEDKDYAGFAHWMRLQFEEEMIHALKIYDYIHERHGRAVLTTIETPQKEWASPLEAFEAAFEHEQYITKRIFDLVTLARSENDHATDSFLGWFVDEQVEEEASVDAVVKDLKRVQNFPSGMFMMDRELGRRVIGGGADPAA